MILTCSTFALNPSFDTASSANFIPLTIECLIPFETRSSFKNTDLALNRLLKGSLYGVGNFEVLPFVGMSLLLMLVTALACLIPALRATRVDPVVALRYE